MCDVSNFALGAILRQRKDNKTSIVYYASRTLDEDQVNYATTEKKFLAVVFSLDKFGSYLTNSKAIVLTNHAALKHLLKKSDSKPRFI